MSAGPPGRDPLADRDPGGDGLGAQLDHLAQLIAAAPLNLVSRADRARIRDVHIEECVALGRLLEVAPAARWLDLGTGGGLPGLVLAVLHPRARWVLLDATSKKVAAVAAFADELQLANVDTVVGRAESLAHAADLRAGFDGVVARAVAPLPVLAELARGFLRAGGTLAAVKGARWREETAAAARALRILRLELVHSVPVPTAARPTWVVTMRAVGQVPRAYPRREGLPQSRPLGRP